MNKKKENSKTFIDVLLHFYSLHHVWFNLVLCLCGCVVCGYVLTLWEKVPFCHHIVAVCHKVQHTNVAPHNANVFLTIDMSDYGTNGITDERGSILTDNIHMHFSDSRKDTITPRPRHHSEKGLCDDEKMYNSLFEELRHSSAITSIPINPDIIEFFHVANYVGKKTAPWVWHFHPLYRDGRKGVKATRIQPLLNEKGGLLDELFLGDILQDLKKDHDIFPVDGFLLDSASTHLSTTILFSDPEESVNLTAKPSAMSLMGILKAIIKPYDISKQLVYVGYLAEAIDTFQIKLDFGEIVKFSPYKNHGELLSANSFTYTSTASERHARGGADRLYHRLKLAGSNENIEYTESIKDLEKNAISLYVEKKSSQMIQWIRVSLLVLLLGYLFTRVILCLTRIIGLSKWFYQREY